MILQAGRALICPGSRHIKVKRLPLGDIVVLSDEPRVNGHRPWADVLFRSVAEEFNKSVAVMMTGMGDDGAEGLGAIKKAGGMTIAQSEESCVVYGMPKAAIERGYATRVVGLEAMGNTLFAQCMADRRVEPTPNALGVAAGTGKIWNQHGCLQDEEETWSNSRQLDAVRTGNRFAILIVDDSVFARKNLTRIIETFGGQVAGEAGDGVTAVRIRPHPSRYRAYGYHHAADGGYRSCRENRAETSRSPHRNGLVSRLPGKYRRCLAARRAAFRAKASKA